MRNERSDALRAHVLRQLLSVARIQRSFLKLVGGVISGLGAKKLEGEVEGDIKRFLLIHSLLRRVGHNKAHSEKQLHIKKCSDENFKRQKDAGMIEKGNLSVPTGWRSWATWKKLSAMSTS